MRKKFLQALGIATFLLFSNCKQLLLGAQAVRLQAPMPIGGLCVAQIADFLLVATPVFLLLAILSLTELFPLFRLTVLLILPVYILARPLLPALRNHVLPHLPFLSARSIVLIAALLWIPSVLMLYVHRRRIYYDIAGIASAALAGLGVFALFGFAQLLWVMHWKPMPRQIIAQWQQSPQPPRNHPLLVWIIFDELAYKQIFEERPADLSVPNFDSLRGQSTLYTDVQPVAEQTALAVPSLLSGAPVDAWKLDMQNRYSVHNSNGDWHPLNGSGTVFGDAQRNGWRTAAVGWYLPYCGLYADALNSCDWSFWDNYNGPVSLHNSFAANTLDPLRYLALEQISKKAAMQVFCAKDMARHADTAAELEPHWIQLLRGDQADFLFIHLGVPHPPNLWNRHDSAYTTVCGGSYIDSLSLADRTLGQILAILRSSPRWNQTTLIVDGDHSWRAPGWRGSTSWTPEDEIVSHHGEFDTRPAVIIHLPGQTQPQTNSSAWPLLRLHDVVEQTLRGQPVTY